MPARELTVNRDGAGRGSEREIAFWGLFAALSALAWVALYLWSASPYGRFLAHGGWADAGPLADLCRAVPQGAVLVPLALHAGAWVLMIAAMMLPTTYPLLRMFGRVVAGRPDAGRLLTLAIAGFVVAWLAFGAAAHGLDAALQWLARRSSALMTHGWLVGALVLAGAGAFQFSALKYRCLEQCHTPFAFVTAHWHGHAPAREAFRLGLDHGVFCVGCCWALMLLMFVVGTASLGFMLALAAMMAAEKNLPGGRRLSAPLGVGLLLWAAGLVVVHL